MTNGPITADAALGSHPPVHREWPYRRTAAMRYGLAVLAVVLAGLARYAIYGEATNRSVFTFFVPAAMVAAWYGGIGPGILATLLGLLVGEYFFFAPRFSVGPLGIRESLGMGVYSVTTPVCVYLCEKLHQTIREFERALEHERHKSVEDLPPAPAKFADYLSRYYAVPTSQIYAYRSWPYHRAFLARYLMAVALVAAAFILRYWLFGTTDHRFPFIFFVPAAMMATFYGGMAPGLLATVLGLMLGDYFFLSEHEAMGVVRESERVAIGLYAVTTTLCVMLIENLHERIRRLEHAFDHARYHRHKPQLDAPAGRTNS